MADPTLEDIARQSGVSRSTVSRVVNNHPNVRADVRQRVMTAIKEAGYHPNLAARTLVSRRTGLIGLILPRSVSSFFADPYFPRLTQGIAQACNRNNYTLALFLVSTREDEEMIFPRVSRKGFLDGILVQSGQIGDQLIDSLIATRAPLVVIGRPLQAAPVSYIDVDNVTAAYQAVSHLIRLGYRRVATITGSPNSTVTIDRTQGYLKALADHGRPVEASLMAEGDFTEAGGYYAMRQLLAARPDAVFAASDLMAVGAMRAAREAGFGIPADIAFVGFDDLPIANTADLQLTTIRQPVHPCGFTAVEILIDTIENGVEPPRRVIMDARLVIRESCGAVRREQGQVLV